MEFKNTRIYGFDSALKGMRFPMESNYKSDSLYHDFGGTSWDMTEFPEQFTIGKNDLALAQKLIRSGSPHDKFLRQIGVWVEITAPLYFWSEMDTYKVGTVADSSSTMHKLGSRELVKEDFEDRYLTEEVIDYFLPILNKIQSEYQKAKEQEDYKASEILHHQLKAMLPCSYLQKRMWSANYAALRNIYRQRRSHRLSEWSNDYCKWIDGLPYAKEFITYGLDGAYDESN